MHNPESVLENERLGFSDTNGSPNLGHPIIPSHSQQKKKKRKKKRTNRIVNFAIPVDHWVKLKGNEQSDKYLDHARELKTMEQERDGDTNCNWYTWNNL